MIRIKSKNIVLKDKLFDGYVYLDKGIIVEVSKEEKPADKCFDCGKDYVSPGFIEMHTHGGGGYPFINNTVDDVINACNFHLKHGTTTILPTVTAGPFENMKKATLNVIEAIKTNKIKCHVPGVHMEGPYLSKKQCGAQCTDYITLPNKEDYVPFVNEYGNYIKKWTYAAENDKEGEFARFISSHNIIPSIGHSDATYSDVVTAIKNGTNMITHLYSCTSSITRDHGFRILGVTECAYLFDELTAEIIADGKHLPPELLKMIIKNIGTDRLVLVSDSLEIAGSDIKEGLMSGTAFIVEDGVCKLLDRTAFAGSVATDEILVKTIVNTGTSIVDAVKMITYNPAKLLKLNKGQIKKGFDADIVIFNDEFQVSNVFVDGELVA